MRRTQPRSACRASVCGPSTTVHRRQSPATWSRTSTAWVRVMESWDLEHELEAYFMTQADAALLRQCRDAYQGRFEPGTGGSGFDALEERAAVLAEDLETTADRAIPAAKGLLYVALGTYGAGIEREEWIQRVRTGTALLEALGVFSFHMDYVCGFAKSPNPALDFLDVDPMEKPESTSSRSFSLSLAFLFVFLAVDVDRREATRDPSLDPGYVSVLVSIASSVCRLLLLLAEKSKDDPRIRKALMVLKSVLRIVVSSKEVREALKPVRFALEGLSTVEAETESSQYVSPADYSRFVAATRVRYPSVVLPELKELFSLDLPWHFLPGVNEDDRLEAPPDEQESLQNELLSPTMAVAEAARAFASRTGLRVDDVQVARERLGQLRAGYGLMDSAAGSELPAFRGLGLAHGSYLQAGDELYETLLPDLPALLGVLIRILYYTNLGQQQELASAASLELSSAAGAEPVQDDLQSGAAKRQAASVFEAMSAREAVSNAVASIVLDLMRVSKRTHFLRLEHVCQILHDNNGPILILKLLSTWFQPRTDAAQAYPGPQTVTDAPADVDAAAGSGLAGLPKWLQRRVTPEDLCTFPVGAAPEDELVPHRRNLSTSCLLLGALHHLTKRRPTRIAALVQWKASAVLKRILRVEHDELRVRALKILKSQLPYLGKKWRNANMRVITAIYLHLGLDFAELTDRDEPSGTDGEPVSADDEVLRSVVSFYHSRRFPYITGAQKDAAAPYLPDVNLAWNLNGPQVAFHDDIELPDPAVLDRPLPWWPPVDCNDFADSRHEVTRPPATG